MYSDACGLQAGAILRDTDRQQLQGFDRRLEQRRQWAAVFQLADDLVSTLCLATTAPISIAPAMNHRMWLHPATQANVDTLRRRGVQVIGPDDGPLAEGESGPGRMSEPGAIVAAIAGAMPGAMR